MAKKTYPGIVIRHGRNCRTATGAACNCEPSYRAWVFDSRANTKISKTFRNLSEAKGWRSDASGAVRKGALRAATRSTLNDAAELFIAGIDAGTILNRKGEPYKPSVRRAYTTDLRKFVLPDLGAARFADIRRADVQALVDRLLTSGQSPTRIHGIVMPLRAICRRAIERDELAINPTANLRLPVANGTRERVASATEAARLLAALAVPDRALWATAFYAGLRRGELRGLRWSDVDLEANVIAVVRSWDDVEGAIAPKSEKGRRRVPIPAVLRKFLLEHKALTGRRGDELVFGSQATHPFTSTNVRKRAHKAWAATVVGEFFAGRSADLEPIGLHECRHTYVSLMHDAGFTLEHIGDYIGHSSAYMTDRYRHLIDGHEAAAVERLDGYLAGTAS
jgi:integrase